MLLILERLIVAITAYIPPKKDMLNVDIQIIQSDCVGIVSIQYAMTGVKNEP